jgi:hypothetical protein
MRPSFNESWMNWRMPPVLNRLDHEPRDELEEDKEGVKVGAIGDGRYGHSGEGGLDLMDLVMLK